MELGKIRIVKAVRHRNYHRTKFKQVQRSLQLARNIALNQFTYEKVARGFKILKIQAFSRCKEGTIIDGALKNPNRTGCNVIETITVLNFCKLKAH